MNTLEPSSAYPSSRRLTSSAPRQRATVDVPSKANSTFTTSIISPTTILTSRSIPPASFPTSTNGSTTERSYRLSRSYSAVPVRSNEDEPMGIKSSSTITYQSFQPPPIRSNGNTLPPSNLMVGNFSKGRQGLFVSQESKSSERPAPIRKQSSLTNISDSLNRLTLSNSRQPLSLDQEWKRRSIEVLPDLYFSEHDLSHHRIRINSPKSKLMSSRTQFVELSKHDLIEPTWAQTTEYYGPLCVEHLQQWRSIFQSYRSKMSRTEDSPNSRGYCFYIRKTDYRSTHMDPRKKDKMLTNAAILISASLVMWCGLSPEDAFAPFQKKFSHLFMHFGGTDGMKRGISIEACLMGLWKGIQLGFMNPMQFQSNTMDFTWIIDDKIGACCTPTNASIASYANFFVSNNIGAVVRLNDSHYDKNQLIWQGIKHLDIPFFDGGVPSSDTVQAFLNFVERRQGATVVHCRGGIGRTGTLICCYLMKHYRMTAHEAIGFIRMRRPGSVNCNQQKYLEDLQANIWKMGESTGSSKLPGPSMEIILSSKFDLALRSLGITFNVDNMDDHVVFTVRQLKTFFIEIRKRIQFPTTTRLPFKLPPISAKINSEGKQKLRITLEDLMYIVDNIMCGCRIDVMDDFEQEREGQKIFG